MSSSRFVRLAPPNQAAQASSDQIRGRSASAPNALHLGERLILDEAYRLAHLPLVAPDHPSVIRTREGSSYVMGRHDRVFSLVLPISGDLLHRSPAYGALNEALRASPFSHKIAWDLLDRRKDKLHATICGSLQAKSR